MITYSITLDPDGSTYDPMVLYQGDMCAHTMEISIYENDGQPKDLTAHLVSVTIQHANGHMREKLLTKKDGAIHTVLWTLIKEDLVVPGKTTATIHVYGADDSKQSYPEFDFKVEAASYGEDTIKTLTDYDLYINARHCGSYSNATRYFMNNIVEYAGGSFMALRDTLGNPPPVSGLSNPYWHKIASPGEIDWRGEYQEGIGYGVGAVVGYGGSAWICIQEPLEGTSDIPSETSECWDLMARCGLVQSVNGVSPDSQGDVRIDYFIQTVNGVLPDSHGNAQIDISHIATPHIDFAPPPTSFATTLTATGWSHGASVSGSNPSTDISGGTDAKLQISVDGDALEEITLTLANCNSGVNIAAELQSRIQALGGKKAGVTAQYDDGVFVIMSPTNTAGSAVIITDGSTANVADNLKLGIANGGVETKGGEQTVNHVAIYSSDAPGDIKIADNSTDEQFLAWLYAQPRKIGQTQGSITIKIVGDMPMTDIPIEIEVR